ncbi:MAG TPA: hypothetical protein VFU29_07185 [Chitinophagaceae bacterium]|nr:hypothetical protein [Chitinophagaceae bacterium]
MSALVISFFLLVKTETLSAQKKNSNQFLPHHVKVQYAGGTGFISIGFGYSNKNQKLEADLFYGYLPKSIGGVRIHSISTKFIWLPINAMRIKKYILEPLMTGLVVNYSFGKQYFSFDPPNYPYRYYSFPTAIHSALFFGSRAGVNLPTNSFVRRLSLYYEIVSFDREIISLLSNQKSLHLPDIVTLSLGVKISIE